MHKVLQSYLKRLTNLSSNNRSLYLPRLMAGHFIDVHDFDYLNNFSSFRIMEWLIAGGALETEGASDECIPLCAVLDSRDAAANKVSLKVKKLFRAEQFIQEEQGSRDLYVGWPFVRGKFRDGTLVRAPLMFFPVRLEVRQTGSMGQQWVLCLRKEVSVSLNKSFLLAYAYYNQLPFEEALSDMNFDELSTDSRIFRTSLYQTFKESSIQLHFNQELFVDKLQPFQEMSRAALSETEKNGVLKLYPEAVLGLFPQAGSYLLPDYIKLMENKNLSDIEAFFEKRAYNDRLAGTTLQPVGDAEREQKDLQYLEYASRVREEQIITPFALDAHQEKALRLVKRGNSIVVQGPPGTGKSQLIANLLADSIAHGKRVLLVSQKKAALDVVYNRLKQKDLHPFAALVHDFKNDRKAIFQQIGRQIDSLYEYQLKNNSLDSIYLERNFLKISRRIEQICEELSEFKFALFDESETGVSVKELYLTSSADQPYLALKQEYRHFRIADLQPFIQSLKKFTAAHTLYDKESYPLFDRKSFHAHTIQNLREMKRILTDIPAFKHGIQEEVSRILQEETSYDTCEKLQPHAQDMLAMLEYLSELEVYQYFQHMVSLLEKEADPLWLSNLERVLIDCFHGEGPEISLPTDELGKFQLVLQRAEEARSGLFSRVNWQLFSRDKEFLSRVFEANGLRPDKKGFQVLRDKIDSRLNLEHNFTKLRAKEWLKDVPARENTDGYNKAVIQQWFYLQKQALSAALIFRSFRNFPEYFNVRKMSYEQLRSRIEQLSAVLATMPTHHKEWLEYLTPSQIGRIETQEQSAAYTKTLEQDFDAICAFDALKASLPAHEKEVIYRLLENVEEVTPEQVEQLFQNSIRLAWIDHIEIKYPVLRIVSSDRLKEMEEELQQCMEEKLAISQEILLMKAREKTYYDVEYNRLNNMITYRDLHHQINKKRKIWPLRKLISSFQRELFSLLPCWMASPEAVSAIFPMEEYPVFDLVVFDEASQCFAEKGIPAMYRGQQLVVAGDSKQLSPNDLYQVRWKQEDEPERVEDALPLEAASLLDLASAYLMTVPLKGHYRSKTLDLVDFSNRHFYNSQLQMLPDYHDVLKNEPAIQYLKVDGIWKNQTNDVESRSVVELVETLLENEPEKSIGIITFNARQQEKILDDLEAGAEQKAYSLPASLFVKNIENVQGDERDIIVFSTAYAPDEQGRMSMQFGSLNAEKGENRLNVAITRAREKIYLVSSILPAQLQIEHTRNEGPKMLKAYLDYALKVSEGKYVPAIPPQGSHRTAWFLQNKLIQWSAEETPEFLLQRELPFADLSARSSENAGAYIGLIHADDELYYQSDSVKELHAYRQFTCRRKHWKFKSVYSRQYWQQEAKVKEDILRFLKTGGEKS